MITFQTDESSDNDEKMSDANAALAESSEVLVGDALPESHQVAASCSKFYGRGRAIKNVIRKRSTVTTKKFLPKKGKRFSKPAVMKKLSKSTATSRADGDPNWQIIDGIYENPNSNSPFTEYVGVSRQAVAAESVLDHFLLFFQFQILDEIVKQTNLYYSQVGAAKRVPPNFQTSREELMAFFAIVIAMGLAKLPDIHDYWRTGITSMPWFRTIMSRDCFTTILRFLHLTDNTKQVPKDHPNYSKLFKLGDLPNILSQRFSQLYSPRRELSIDEQMIGTKCRVGFLQYMPKKPKKFGIKVWALCESLSGYCCQFQIYTGRSEGAREHGLSYRVVFDLMSNYLDKGYQLFFDNFYTSLRLVKDLLSRNIPACGTIRVNRGEFPENFKNEKLEPGKSLYIKNGDIMAVHWKDKRDVFVISSFHGNTETNIERHRGKIQKPDVIIDYNQNMGGVDKCDQYISYYTIGRKAQKWWKKVFFRMFEMCVINSMCIYLEKNPEFGEKRNSHKLYREVLVHQLVQPYLEMKNETAFEARGRQAMHEKRRKIDVPDDIRLLGKHYASKKYPRRKCCFCAYRLNSSRKRQNTRTNNYCEKCGKYVCHACFKNFHTQSKV